MTLTKLASAMSTASLLGLAACGGGGDSGSSGALSSADFQRRANAICKQYNADVNKLAAPSGFADVGPFADKAITLTDAAVGKLRALKPPKDQQDDWNQWLDSAAQLDDTAQKLKDAAAKKDAKALNAAGAEADARDKKADVIANRLGLKECAAG